MSQSSIVIKKNAFKGIEFSQNDKPVLIPLDQIEIKSAYDGTKGTYKSKSHTLVIRLSTEAYNKVYDVEKECLDRLVADKIDIKGHSITEYRLMDSYKSSLMADTSSLKVKTSCDQTKLKNVKFPWTSAELHKDLKVGGYANVVVHPAMFWLMEKDDAPTMGISWVLKEADLIQED